jgi:acyl carrier protein
MIKTIEQEIIGLISDIISIDENEIKLETNFVTDLEIDSIKTIEITVAIEKKFKISIRDEDVRKISTVQHAVDIVNQALAQRSENISKS